MGTKWFSRRAWFVHLTALIVLPACVFLAWWQTTRALDGNALSWAYAFEWPVFAVYGAYLWWKLLHEAPDATSATSKVTDSVGEGAASEPGALLAVRSTERGEVADWALVDDEEDPELAAYNRYLAELGSGDSRKRW